MLGLSLLVTWSIAVPLRLYLPRVLGPARFGLYSFADSMAATVTTFIALGVETYTQREIPTRPAHASDYFGGVSVLRLGLGCVVLLALFFGLQLSGRSLEASTLATIFGVGYVVQVIGQSQAALLTANRTVDGLAVANVVTRVAWGGLVGVALIVGAPLEALAGAFVVGELLRAGMMHLDARRRMGLVLRVDARETRRVVVASMPYFSNHVAQQLHRLDVPVLAFMANDDRAVGWYGAATTFSLLIYLFAPLLGSVLLPLMTRAWARSEAELWVVVHRCTGALLAIAVPVALLVALGADVWVRLVFGAAFAPAALSLRAFALQCVLAYLSTVLTLTFITVGRAWSLTVISGVAVLVKPALIVALVPVCARQFGEGGAGVGAALGVVLSEIVMLVLMLRTAGPLAVSPAIRHQAGRTAVVSALVVGIHVALAPLGPWRLLFDMLAYAALGAALGALPLKELAPFVRDLVRARGGQRTSA